MSDQLGPGGSAEDNASGVENQVPIPVLGPLAFPSIHPTVSLLRRGLDTLPHGTACTDKDIEEWERNLTVGKVLEYGIGWSTRCLAMSCWTIRSIDLLCLSGIITLFR